MQLEDLAGKHMLDAVDFGMMSLPNQYDDEFKDCAVMRFRLDGTVYVAAEDESDGYRSMMRELMIGKCVTMQNVFGPIQVTGHYTNKDRHGNEADILQLIDVETGKIVVEVGTENTDDYYPSFVANFSPENMIINKINKQEEHNGQKV